MKIFGLNILTDNQLNEIKSKCTYKSILDYLKIKRIYRVWCSWIDQPKCDKCDENRQYKVKLPDGRDMTVDCSCKRQKQVYEYGEVNPDDYNIIIHKLSGEVYLMEESEYDDYKFHALDTINNLKNPRYMDLFTTEAKAKKAVKILNNKLKEKQNGN